MRLAIPRETAPREQRVSLIPETVAKLVKAGFQAVVEAGAGLAAGHTDAAYQKSGATSAADFAACVAGANAVFKVREPSAEEIAAIPEGALLLGLLGRGEDAAQLERYRSRRLGVFSLNALPRISRAQKMDALSSMAACAGYKAVLLAAGTSGKFFPLLMTAAGTVLGRLTGPRIRTPCRRTSVPASASSQFPPVSTARSTITEPGFINATDAAGSSSGARLPGIEAVEMTTSVFGSRPAMVWRISSFFCSSISFA